VSLIAAVMSGGTLSPIFVVMLILWLHKLGTENQAAEKQATPPRESPPPRASPPAPISSVPTPELPEEYDSKDWENQLTEICSRYSGNDYYVAELIPPHKLGHAVETYPVPGGGRGRGRVIALFDATVFGSAKNGMAIGTKGISWHNIAETKSESMTWDDFSKVRVIRLKNDNVLLVHGIPAISCEFNMGACGFDKNKAVELLKTIQSGYSQREELQSKPRPNLADKVVDIPSASYEELLALPGIGAAEANILLKHHEYGQNLGSIDEMADLLNLKPHIAARLKDRVGFSKSKPQSHVPETPATPATATPTPPFRPNVPGRGRTID